MIADRPGRRLAAKVLRELAGKHPLGQLFLEQTDQARFSKQALCILALHVGKKLVQQLVGERPLRLALPGLLGEWLVGHSWPPSAS